ncbi:MAG: DUF362 domain-containing protein [Desulfobacterales bacterium]|nr:DUF362 domain-containing protein [Desulfobacterales bacterium]
MTNPTVAVVRYEKPMESVRKAVDLSGGLDHLPAGARVFIKPNIVFWTRTTNFPKWGVITTSRVVEDMVRLLKERGVDDITIGEGSVTLDPKDRETQAHAYTSLGYDLLKKRYGVKCVNIYDRPFTKLDLGDDVILNFNTDAVESDFVVDLPVMKTHAQTVVSLGVKNLKGLIDVPSRKKCHNADPEKDLHFHVSRLADKMPPMFTLIDGIYTNERGPMVDGRIRRGDLLVGSADVLAADFVGATMLGYKPSEVPHLAHAARNHGRPADLTDVDVVGDSIEKATTPLEYTFPYNEEGTLPIPLARKGVKGVSYRKYDLTMCTYCSGITGPILTAIAMAWKGKPFDDVEVLTGKVMKPTPGKKKTILLGKCMYKLNKENPDIREMIAVKGCPPKPSRIIEAFHQAGIDIDPGMIEHMDALPGFLMPRYEGKPEFDESFFRVQ